MGYVYIALTIIFTVYGQLVLKWRISLKGALPAPWDEKIIFLSRAFLDPWILSGLFMAFIASVAWMAAMTKLDLSHAYPFMSISFVLVLVLSALFFNEPITWPKLAGLGFIVVGIVVSSQG